MLGCGDTIRNQVCWAPPLGARSPVEGSHGQGDRINDRAAVMFPARLGVTREETSPGVQA